jgi:hypothetical protein
MPQRGPEAGVHRREKRFSWFGCELDLFMPVSTKQKNHKKQLDKIRSYAVFSINRYEPWGTLISIRAPEPGSPVSLIESPVMPRISVARKSPYPLFRK